MGDGGLVLTRRVEQRVLIVAANGQEIWVTVVSIDRRQVQLAFAADDDVHILREELSRWLTR